MYPHSMNVVHCRQCAGGVIHEVLRSGALKIYLFALLCSLVFFSLIDFNDAWRAAQVPSTFATSINTLTIFLLTFFISYVMTKVNARFDAAQIANGAITRVTALAGALFPPLEARALMRYANAIGHLNYFMLSGPMDNDKWDLLKAREILTEEEVGQLQLQGAPVIVIYMWALHILKQKTTNSEGADIRFQIENAFHVVRGQTALQISYTNFQVPFIYFQAVYVTSMVYILCTCYDTGHSYARGINDPCYSLTTFPEDDEGTGTGGCPSFAAVTILVQVVLIMIFLIVLKVAEQLADPYGDRSFHYDLGVDLDNLWKNSQEVLKSMSVPPPKLHGA